MRNLILLLLFYNISSSIAAVVRNCPVKTIEVVHDGIIVTYTFNNPEIVESKYNKGTKYIRYDGFGLNDNDGEPCFPFRNEIFLVPNNCVVSVGMLDSAYTDTTFVFSPSMLVQTDNLSPVSMHSISPYSGFFPEVTLHSNGVFHNREDAFISISITPVKYNYQTNTVRIYTFVKYKLTFTDIGCNNEGGNMSFARKICQNAPHRSNSPESIIRDDRHYLIVTTTEYHNSLEDFIKWKRLKGNNVHVVSRPKGDWTVSAVTDSVQNYFIEKNIKYLLIIGDWDDVPAQNFINHNTLDPIAITDYQYGLPVNEIAQIQRGRIPVNNTTELATILNKIIKYEQSPIIDEEFYNTALHCAQFQDGDVDSTGVMDGYEDRCFTLCVEELRNHLTNNYGKNIIRGYSHGFDIIPAFWNNSIYSYGDSIPPELRTDSFNWFYNGKDIKEVIKKGAFYVLYRGHGLERCWCKPDFPPFPSFIPISNGDKLPFVFSVACLTGKYNVGIDCLVEEQLKSQNGGFVGVIAATGTSYSGYNDAFVYGMFDAIWPGFSPSYGLKGYGNASFSSPTYEVGEIMDLGLLRMSETWGAPRPDRRLKTKKLYHCFCDPSMMLYTENPQYFNNPSIHVKNDTLYVNVLENDCRISIINNTTNVVQSYLGEELSLYIDNNDISVCIDKHNYVPYVWSNNLYIQNENIVSTNKEYHAQNVKVGNSVTNQKPRGNVNVLNSNVSFKANNVLLDKGLYINVGSSLKVKTSR